MSKVHILKYASGFNLKKEESIYKIQNEKKSLNPHITQ